MSGFRQALFTLVRRPGFTLTAVLTLAFGIATTTALFTVMDGVLIRALPYPQSDRLVAVYEASSARAQATSLIAPARLDDWNRLNQTFDVLSGAYAESVTDTSLAEPERLDGRRVMPRFFAVFGVAPLAGRTFTADEEAFAGPGAAVISEGLWGRRYGRNPSAVGLHLVIEGRRYAIVGVMPASFAAVPTDVWLPAQTSPQLAQFRAARFLNGIGRMKPGVSVEQARADLDRVQRGLGAMFPATDADWSATVTDLKHERVGRYQQALGLVFASVVLLLVIAVANIAGLMLVQLRRRERELAVRTALGASRRQIVATVMREATIIAVAGALLGAAGAAGLVEILKRLFDTLPRLAEIGLDWRALTMTALVSTVVTIACGWLPAWMVTRHGLALAIASDTRSVAGSRHRLQQLLVVAQIAISLVLVASAGLLLRSYANLARVDVGFNADEVITFRVGAGWSEDRGVIGRMQQRLIDELQQRPGVQAAGMGNFLPIGGATLRYQVVVSGVTGPDANGAMTVGTRMVSDGYLRALQVPLLSGEWCPPFAPDDEAPNSVVINRQFVDTFAAGQNLVGRDLRLTQTPTMPLRIVGVIGNMAEDGAGAATMPYIYTCLSAQSWPDPNYVVRTRDPEGLLREVRSIVHGVSPTRAVFGVRTLEEALQRSLDRPRLDAQLLAVFAAAAILLAALGLYGLFMLLVAERRRELGVRLALGAEPGHLVGLVFSGAGKIVIAGALIGLGLTIAAGRMLEALLFGLSPLDPFALAGGLGVLAAVALVAVAVPAVRASRVDPVDVLRA